MPFSITPDAVVYIKKYVIGEDAIDEMVVVVVPSVDVHQTSATEGTRSIEDLTANARAYLAKLPRNIALQWSIGAVRKNRVPPQSCRDVDGVTVYVPAEMEDILSTRVLTLEGGELRFDPPLTPLEVHRED